MKNHHSTYQDRVARIVESDSITSTNLRALPHGIAVAQETGLPADEAMARYQNVRDWLVKSALRRHRKANAPAHGPLNNAMGLAFKAIKARAGK